jgi:hypothetical protein
MGNDIGYQWMVNGDEAVYGIVDNFSLPVGHPVAGLLNKLAWCGQKYDMDSLNCRLIAIHD